MSHPPPLSAPQAPHNHDHCVSHALQAAEQVCTREGVRFTALRKRVLELVWQSHKPLGAYDILDTLSRDDGRRAAPPTVSIARAVVRVNSSMLARVPGPADALAIALCHVNSRGVRRQVDAALAAGR